ncbi:MAG: type II toxin-antitoxin system PemK/MazF family toxin [Firmicutes bacterium]|nr:type II toxin-antitoxin system PemK/MazF family toxin [Bacillota bacterium]
MEPKEWMLKKKYYIRKGMINALIKDARSQESLMLRTLNEEEVYDYMVSKLNYCVRKEKEAVESIPTIEEGDICYIDFGNAYINEAGYLHFGLVLSVNNRKVFVVPMTSNEKAVFVSQFKDHLMPFPKIRGLKKKSAVFLNDAKWINAARVIDVKAHIDPMGPLFQKIQQAIIDLIVL